jgi:hypothetical protein
LLKFEKLLQNKLGRRRTKLEKQEQNTFWKGEMQSAAKEGSKAGQCQWVPATAATAIAYSALC